MSNTTKPKVRLVGEDGNVYNLLAICINALERAGQHENAEELQKRVTSCGSYYEALSIMSEYIDQSGGDSNDEYDDE